jgi:hypothetical protein
VYVWGMTAAFIIGVVGYVYQPKEARYWSIEPRSSAKRLQCQSRVWRRGSCKNRRQEGRVAFCLYVLPEHTSPSTMSISVPTHASHPHHTTSTCYSLGTRPWP